MSTRPLPRAEEDRRNDLVTQITAEATAAFCHVTDPTLRRHLQISTFLMAAARTAVATGAGDYLHTMLMLTLAQSVPTPAPNASDDDRFQTLDAISSLIGHMIFVALKARLPEEPNLIEGAISICVCTANRISADNDFDLDELWRIIHDAVPPLTVPLGERVH